MKKHIVRAVLAAALLCGSAGAVMIGTTSTAMAAEHVSRKVGEPLNDAIQAIQKKDFATAHAKIAEAEAITDKTDYESYRVNDIKAYLAAQEKDYPTALTAYEAMVASPTFASQDPKDQAKTLFFVMQLSGMQSKWPEMISAAEKYQKFQPLDSDWNANMALAYYRTNQPEKATEAAKKSIEQAKAAGKKPQQVALQILMNSEVKNDQGAAAKTLEQLALNYGGADNWWRLISASLDTKNMRDKDAIYMYRLILFANAKPTPSDYHDAAVLALKLNYPVEAEAAIQKAFAGGASKTRQMRGLLGQAQTGARLDRSALRSIEREAERSKEGFKDILLAEDYWGYGRYADAAKVAKRGLAKGHVKDPGDANLILGAALVASGQYADARAALAKVDGSPGRAKAAHLWDLYAQYKMNQGAAAANPPAQQ